MAYDVNMSLAQSLRYFNANRLPDVYNVPEPYMHFLFMGRPDLNIFDSSGNPLPEWVELDSYAFHLLNGDNRMITKGLTDLAGTNFIPFVTSKVKSGYQIDNRALKTIEKGTTFQGNTIQYGIHSNEHKKARTITLEFENDRHLTVWKFNAAWRDYIDIISFRSKFSPKQKYIYPEPSLDYAAPLFYFVTKMDGRTLVYWDKTLGVFPVTVPDDLFNATNNGKIFEPTVSVTYAASIKSDPNLLSVLEDFNALSSDRNLTSLYKADGKGILQPKSVLCKSAYVSKHPSKNTFYLNYGGAI